MSDSINMREMHSYPDWERLARRRDFEWFQPQMEPQWVAWWVEILKQSEDFPELFPHGKWASIQRLQDKLSAVAAGERFKIQEQPYEGSITEDYYTRPKQGKSK